MLVVFSEGAGARTLDLRIKSPLLYQLSYALRVYAVFTDSGHTSQQSAN